MSLPTIYGLGLAFGLVNALDNPVRRVFVSELVGTDDLVNAIGLNTSLMTGSRVIGPTLAGLLIPWGGVGWCFLVNALTYPAVLAGLAMMDRDRFRGSPPSERTPGQLRSGLRYLASEPGLRIPLTILAIAMTFGYQYEVTLPLLAEGAYDGGATTFTVLYATLSVGSVVGALLLARLTRARLRHVVVGAWGFAGTGIALAWPPTSRWPPPRPCPWAWRRWSSSPGPARWCRSRPTRPGAGWWSPSCP